MANSQLPQYIPILMLLVAAVGFAAGVLMLSVLVGFRTKHSRAKDTAYECGKDPIGEGSARFSVKFYLVAMLFILFDIEVVFLYPWAVAFRGLGMMGFIQVVTFFALLTTGYVYVWRKGVFDWGGNRRR